jgi:GT2 family glycosyltransferase
MISIVIPNYNTWNLVARNIDSLYKYDANAFGEIIVVDDCSPTPRPVDFYPEVKVIRNSQNLHYTKTVNVGLNVAKGDIVILLDSDAYLIEPICQHIQSAFEEDERLACLGFDTVGSQGKQVDNFLYEPTYRSLVSGQQIHKLLKPFLSYRGKKEYPFSCAVAFRKAALNELQYFDEAFPVLEADHDLSRRIHMHAYWHLKYSRSIKVYHEGGGSIPKNSDRVLKFYKYRWQYLRKHGMLPFKEFLKGLILCRVFMEFMLFCFLSIFKKNMGYKIKGRIELFKLVFSLK